MSTDLPLIVDGDLGKSIAATMQHIELVRAREQKLAVAREAAQNQLFHRIGAAHRSGEIGDVELIAIFEAVREVNVLGSRKAWDKNIETGWLKMKYLNRQLANGPEGTWIGESPCASDAPAPTEGIPVVYVLFDDTNAPCYVGSTDNFRQRIKAHAKQGKHFARWQAHRCRDREHAYELEVRLLKENKPYLNRKVSR